MLRLRPMPRPMRQRGEISLCSLMTGDRYQTETPTPKPG